jgi:predicted metal-dependent hydrolase
LSTARSSARALFHHELLPVPVELRPLRTARRLRLRYDAGRHLLTLTGPWRMNRRDALAWAAEQRAWVDAQIAARLENEPFVPGAVIPLEGEDTLLVWSETRPRTPSLHEADGIRQLVCGGPRESFERRVEAWLRRRALETLSRETAEIAQMAGLAVRGVSVGDAGTRWGSCSSVGRIRYSWRLILAPVDVRRLVVAHEVAHVAHLNHGPEFKALERRLFGGDVTAARALLRSVGPGLRRFGRGR